MSSRVNRGQLVVLNENLPIHHKKPIVDGNANILRTNLKKGSAKNGGRKALNDVTNKSSLSHDVSTKKNNISKAEFNVAEERFLHDHRKCVKAQQMVLDTSLLDLLLPTRGKVIESIDGRSGFDKEEEPEELPILEVSEWLEPCRYPTPDSPFNMDSPPSSPLAWHFKTVEFTLRPGDGE